LDQGHKCCAPLNAMRLKSVARAAAGGAGGG
jgi:hypothetical protein